MRRRTVVPLLAALMSVAAVARPDTRIVQTTHQDSFTVMGQTQPAKDEQQVLWIGADRMRPRHPKQRFPIVAQTNGLETG